MKITDDIKYIGVYDEDIDLFESQYKAPEGITYNSYVILDEKITIFDTVDKRAGDKWLENLESVLQGKEPSYMVISHLEPDHSYNIKVLCDKYPNMQIIANAQTFGFLPNFFTIDNLEQRKVLVTEGQELSIGKHTLQFFMAPMVHWPEVMVTYDKLDKVLFSADAFGRFGKPDENEPWVDEARRFFINIVGKYGVQVQALLNKAKTLDIQTICSLHGPVLTHDLGQYIEKYDIWSKYIPESEGTLILHASIHGNTKIAAEKLNDIMHELGEITEILDLTRCDMSKAISDCFKYGKIVLLASTYNMGVFPPMEQLLRLVVAKNIQNKKIAIVENGTWAPAAARTMKGILEPASNIEFVEPIVTIKTTVKETDIENLKELAKSLI